ncbi:hypothetical protein AFLA_004306 [Aspergillus flavus NRRL3357]|nr:hypothetical protein AFLA_004306 [Aspergillus flavus NRRL3357]
MTGLDHPLSFPSTDSFSPHLIRCERDVNGRWSDTLLTEHNGQRLIITGEKKVEESPHGHVCTTNSISVRFFTTSLDSGDDIVPSQRCWTSEDAVAAGASWLFPYLLGLLVLKFLRIDVYPTSVCADTDKLQPTARVQRLCAGGV